MPSESSFADAQSDLVLTVRDLIADRQSVYMLWWSADMPLPVKLHGADRQHRPLTLRYVHLTVINGSERQRVVLTVSTI